MKKILSQWILPLGIAIVVVVITRLCFIEIEKVPDNSLQYSFSRKEKLVFFKFFNPEKNRIVLVKDFPSQNKTKIQRIIALPGDTIRILNSLIYINNHYTKDLESISYTYTFQTDSSVYASKFLSENNIDFNKKLSEIGIFSFDADYSILEKIKLEKLFRDVKRDIKEKNVYLSPILSLDYTIYWNKDNFGPLLVPFKGLKIRMNDKSYILYKNLIEEESGMVLERKSNQFFLNEMPIETYIFKLNYYFLMNDKRSNNNDSREYGFVPEKKIVGVFLLNLSWN